MANVLFLPFPSRGHINPMLDFAKRLSSKGPRTTLVTTFFVFDSIKPSTDRSSVHLAAISDGHDEGGYSSASSLEGYLQSLEDVGSETLAKLILEQEQSGFPFTCIVYDSFLPWAARVGKKLGLQAVGFSTQCCAVGAIYYFLKKGELELPSAAAGSKVRVSIAGLPPLMERSDFPSYVFDQDKSNRILTALAVNQFELEKDDWILFNSFDDLENEVVKSLNEHLINARTIGPCALIDDSTSGNLNFHEAEEDACVKWLDTKPPKSVVYVSFGSFASLCVEQMEELAYGLRQSGKHFLWVVKEKEQKTLPADFKAAGQESVLIVKWCPQLRVLAHEAVGCFLTHCGWNSTLEALSMGVPMVAMAMMWNDMPTNAKCVQDVWGVGVRAKPTGAGAAAASGSEEAGMSIKRDEIERCIREVMDDGEKAGMIRRNSKKWSELAKQALSHGGSSDRNLDEFVGFLQAMNKGKIMK